MYLAQRESAVDPKVAASLNQKPVLTRLQRIAQTKEKIVKAKALLERLKNSTSTTLTSFEGEIIAKQEEKIRKLTKEKEERAAKEITFKKNAGGEAQAKVDAKKTEEDAAVVERHTKSVDRAKEANKEKQDKISVHKSRLAVLQARLGPANGTTASGQNASNMSAAGANATQAEIDTIKPKLEVLVRSLVNITNITNNSIYNGTNITPPAAPSPPSTTLPELSIDEDQAELLELLDS